jgi:hypothetical protein
MQVSKRQKKSSLDNQTNRIEHFLGRDAAQGKRIITDQILLVWTGHGLRAQNSLKVCALVFVLS